MPTRQFISNYAKTTTYTAWPGNELRRTILEESDKAVQDTTQSYIKCETFLNCLELWTEISVIICIEKNQNQINLVRLLEISFFKYICGKYDKFENIFTGIHEEDKIFRKIDEMIERESGFEFEFTQIYNMVADPNSLKKNIETDPQFRETEIIFNYFAEKIKIIIKGKDSNTNGHSKLYTLLNDTLFELHITNFAFLIHTTNNSKIIQDINKWIKTISNAIDRNDAFLKYDENLSFPAIFRNMSSTSGLYKLITNKLREQFQEVTADKLSENLVFNGNEIVVSSNENLKYMNEFAMVANTMNDVYREDIVYLTEHKMIFRNARKFAPYLRHFCAREFDRALSDSEKDYLKFLLTLSKNSPLDYLPESRFTENPNIYPETKSKQINTISELLADANVSNKYTNIVFDKIASRSHFKNTKTARQRVHPENKYVKDVNHHWPLYASDIPPKSLQQYTDQREGDMRYVHGEFVLDNIRSFLSSTDINKDYPATDFVRYVPFLSRSACVNIVRNFINSSRFGVLADLCLMVKGKLLSEKSVKNFPYVVDLNNPDDIKYWTSIFNVCESALASPILDTFAGSTNKIDSSTSTPNGYLDKDHVRYARLILAAIHRVQECKKKKSNPNEAKNMHIEYNDMLWYYGGDYKNDPVDVYDETGELQCIEFAFKRKLDPSDASRDFKAYNKFCVAFNHAEVIISSSPLFATNAWFLCQEFPVLKRVTCGMMQRSDDFVKGLASVFLVDEFDFTNVILPSFAFVEEYYYSVELVKKILMVDQNFDTEEKYVMEVRDILATYVRFIREQKGSTQTNKNVFLHPVQIAIYCIIFMSTVKKEEFAGNEIREKKLTRKEEEEELKKDLLEDEQERTESRKQKNGSGMNGFIKNDRLLQNQDDDFIPSKIEESKSSNDNEDSSSSHDDNEDSSFSDDEVTSDGSDMSEVTSDNSGKEDEEDEEDEEWTSDGREDRDISKVPQTFFSKKRFQKQDTNPREKKKAKATEDQRSSNNYAELLGLSEDFANDKVNYIHHINAVKSFLQGKNEKTFSIPLFDVSFCFDEIREWQINTKYHVPFFPSTDLVFKLKKQISNIIAIKQMSLMAIKAHNSEKTDFDDGKFMSKLNELVSKDDGNGVISLLETKTTFPTLDIKSETNNQSNSSKHNIKSKKNKKNKVSMSDNSSQYDLYEDENKIAKLVFRINNWDQDPYHINDVISQFEIIPLKAQQDQNNKLVQLFADENDEDDDDDENKLPIQKQFVHVKKTEVTIDYVFRVGIPTSVKPFDDQEELEEISPLMKLHEHVLRLKNLEIHQNVFEKFENAISVDLPTNVRAKYDNFLRNIKMEQNQSNLLYFVNFYKLLKDLKDKNNTFTVPYSDISKLLQLLYPGPYFSATFISQLDNNIKNEKNQYESVKKYYEKIEHVIKTTVQPTTDLPIVEKELDTFFKAMINTLNDSIKKINQHYSSQYIYEVARNEPVMISEKVFRPQLSVNDLDVNMNCHATLMLAIFLIGQDIFFDFFCSNELREGLKKLFSNVKESRFLFVILNSLMSLLLLQVNVWAWEHWLLYYYACKIIIDYLKLELVKDANYNGFISWSSSRIGNMPDVIITLKNNKSTFEFNSSHFHTLNQLIALVQSSSIIKKDENGKYLIENQINNYFQFTVAELLLFKSNLDHYNSVDLQINKDDKTDSKLWFKSMFPENIKNDLLSKLENRSSEDFGIEAMINKSIFLVDIKENQVYDIYRPVTTTNFFQKHVVTENQINQGKSYGTLFKVNGANYFVAPVNANKSWVSMIRKDTESSVQDEKEIKSMRLVHAMKMLKCAHLCYFDQNSNADLNLMFNEYIY